jgi:uncharacterized protein (TIGR04255 family)
VRVLAQARFPAILAIRLPDRVAAFQEAIRGRYPILGEDRVQSVQVGPSMSPRIKEDVIWRFADKDGPYNWRVSLGVDFVSLETTTYLSRADFLSRLREVVGGVEETFRPQEAVRIGLRYIDRQTGEAVAQAPKLIRSAVLGVAGTEVGDAAKHVITEALLEAAEGQIQARWGRLPAAATVDPSVLEPINEPSWILDLDMFGTEKQPFTTDGILKIATSFAERIYTVFRWMVTDDFLKFYGGKL